MQKLLVWCFDMDYEYFYSIILLGIAGFVALAFGIRKDNKKAMALFTLIVLALAFILSLIFSNNYSSYGLIFNDFDSFWALIFIASSMMIVIPSLNDIRGRYDVFYSLIIFMTLSMLVSAYTYNLLILFVSFEGVSIITYVLAAYNKTRRNLEGSLKYFIISTVGTAFNVLGISFFYLGLRTFNLFDVNHIYFDKAVLIAFIFIIIGFGFKLAIFPMQQWAIDTYDGSPNSISAFLSTGSKIVAYMILLKILVLGFSAFYNYVFYFFAILSILTMTYGNVAALSQNNLKRILAYSSVSQAGYLILVYALIGYSYYNISSPVPAATYIRLGIATAMFYSLVYIFMKGGSFIAMSLIRKDKIMIDDIKGLSKKSPASAFSFWILLISLAGVPITGGFLAKYFLFFSLVAAGLWWLAVIAIINSVISVFYYFRIIRESYVYDSRVEFNLTPSVKYSLIATAVLTVAFGVVFFLYTYLVGIAVI